MCAAARWRCVADDDCALLDGRIEIARDDEVGAGGGQARGERGGERDEAGVGVAGVDKLRGLGDVFGGGEARLERVVELEAGEGGDGGAAVGRAVGIGDGEALEGGVAEQIERRGRQVRVFACPEDQRAFGVGDGRG